MRKILYGVIVMTALVALSGTQARAADKETASAADPAKLVTLDYAGAEVTDVIRALAAQSGVNVALNPNAKGQVTVHLRDKTVDEAMTVVANLAGLGAKKIGGTYVIAPRAEMRQTLERLGTSRSVSVQNIPAQSAADLVQAAFSDLTARPQGKAVALIGAPEDLDAAERMIHENDTFSPDQVHTVEKVTLKYRPAAQTATAVVKMTPGLSAEAAGESVILSGTKATVEAGKRSMEMLDVPMQPDTDVRIYEVKYAFASQLVELLEKAAPDVQVVAGPDSAAPDRPLLNILSGQFVGFDLTSSSNTFNGGLPGSANPMTPGGGPATKVNRKALTLLLKGTPAALDQAVKVLTLMDVPPRQMMIEAKVVETSPEFTKNLGVEWQWNPFEFAERPSLSGSATPDSRPKALGPLGFGSFGRVQFAPTATLNAMITNRQAKLLANPQIAVINDQDASIFIGDTLRFQSLAQSSPTTGNQFTVVEVPVGIILLVHPRVNDEGNITLRVHPVVSTVSAIVNGLPQTSAREAETTVRVKDGDTLVIGGLIRDEDIRTMSKIPLLGDLPLIGNLFRNELRNHRRTEVMVVLTIHLIR
jgi:type II secretory pathway component GspD/PulD (secretin)